MSQVHGLHHVTMIASRAAPHDAFYRHKLGLRRVKVTVNFDAPDVYHLYYGTEMGAPGTAITSFPFGAQAAPGRRGAGEAGETAYAVPRGSLDAWAARLGGARETRFGEARLALQGPDGEGVTLVEGDDPRAPWTGEVPAAEAIRGFHSVTLTLQEAGPTADLLRLMGYEEEGREGAVTRMRVRDGNGADAVDLVEAPDAPWATQSAGSVHHVAFAVPDDAAQAAMRAMLARAGVQATPVIDRDYFHSIYFRTPGGVLFEVATDAPGFARDEAPDALGTALKLPRQHEPLRDRLRRTLEPLEGLA
jgi:glyoxalase family protein